jgi:hypothetical protein
MPRRKQLGNAARCNAGDTSNQRSNMHLKIISVIAIASAALALGAPAALAEEFAAKEYPAKITGKTTSVQEFALGENTIDCSEGSFTGELSKASIELGLTPAYSTCKATISGLNVDALISILEGFKFTLKIHSLFKWLTSFLKGKIEFKVEVLECEITVPSEQLLENVSGENASGKIDLAVAITGIKQTNTCGLGSANAAYKGKVELSATNSKGEADPIEA